MTVPSAPETISILRGGEWLLEPTSAASVFTPERLTEEHKLIGRTTEAFVAGDDAAGARPARAEGLGTSARSLVKRSGDLGLLGVDVPEA